MWSEKLDTARWDIEATFDLTYSTIRTIAMLPGVRKIDRYAERFMGDPQLTVQQLYNNLASHVDISEVYIVPGDFDPELIDPNTGQPQEPITHYDELITGQDGCPHDAEEETGLPEEEIHEYRQMKRQARYFRDHYPDLSHIEGLDFPALVSREVITCDNRDFTRQQLQEGNNSTRMGIICSVPFYGPDGRFKGMVCGVLRSLVLSRVLDNPFIALHNLDTADRFTTAARAGEATGFLDRLREGQTPAGYAFTHADPCRFPNLGASDRESWRITAAVPDSAWKASPHLAKAKQHARTVMVGGMVISGLLSCVLWSLTRTRNRARGLAAKLTASLRGSEERFALAVQGSRDGLWDWDLTTNRVYYAPKWKELLGCDPDQVGDLPNEWFSRITSSDLTPFHALLTQHIEGKSNRLDTEIQMHHEDGGTRWMLCRAVAVRNEGGKAVRLAGTLADISDLKQTQEELRHMAQHDILTGLPNRELFTDRVRRCVARVKRDPSCRYAVLFFDFDRFKVINDSLGHDIGDLLLKGIADRFRAHIREMDTAARFGGDEFVLLLDGVQDLDQVAQASERLLGVFAQPHHLDGHEVVSTASIGVVSSEFGYEDAEDVIRDADTAMYQAKTSGKAKYCLFDHKMHQQALERLNLEQDLRNVRFEDEFQLLYQPIVSLHTGQVAGFEALVRWNHRTQKLIGPDLFISIAEETGLIIPLGEWVLREACRQLRHWRAGVEEHDPLTVNVNLSKRQLVHPDLTGMINRALDEFGIVPTDIKLEITETTIMDNRHDMVPVLENIRGTGIKLAMDDFGTGHSSLSCLHRFPLDVLKIDRSFIRNMEEHREFTAVVQAIISLAEHLKIEVVAEGIENQDQLAQLQAMDCMYGQGYLFAKPLNAEEAGAFWRQHNGLKAITPMSPAAGQEPPDIHRNGSDTPATLTPSAG